LQYIKELANKKDSIDTILRQKCFNADPIDSHY